MSLNQAAGGNSLISFTRENKKRKKKPLWSSLGSPRNGWPRSDGGISRTSQIWTQAAVSFRGSRGGGAECWVLGVISFHFFSLFLHFQFSHSISNFFRSEATSWDWKGTIEKKDKGVKKNPKNPKPTSNLVKVSFEKSIFLCDKICLRLFVLWNQPIVLREHVKEAASVVWNNSD